MIFSEGFFPEKALSLRYSAEATKLLWETETEHKLFPPEERKKKIQISFIFKVNFAQDLHAVLTWVIFSISFSLFFS